ncbi:hypothetical protein ACFVIM_19565 [Streptomyces sp. NPDC057638]|uniref:hypothetical protein n=1 Tax=Streptomyces sp. NPDC057638 TaxID=3346190 RepID=UPI00368E74E0
MTSSANRERVLAIRESIIFRYRDGQSARRLAREFGVSAGWLGEQLRAWGVPTRNAREANHLYFHQQQRAGKR